MKLRYHGEGTPPTIAYFSMEIGLEPKMPTYSGGLGILAGDTLRAAADLSIPLVGITLLHRKGYFSQKLDSDGNQTEQPFDWNPADFLEPLLNTVSIEIEGRKVKIRPWRYTIRGSTKFTVPVYLLDTKIEGNSDYDRTLTDYLYGGDLHYRLCQEAVLGLGGISIIRSIGLREVQAYHMNEGHSAFLGLALLEELLGQRSLYDTQSSDLQKVKKRCIFTTHTPVPAGHDKFPLDLVKTVLGENKFQYLASTPANIDNSLNMTSLALMFSWFVNGVSHRHEMISQNMFPEYPIDSITNGVHVFTWTSEPFRKLYDQHMDEWREDSLYLRYAINIPISEIIKTHAEAKKLLIEEVKKRTGQTLSEKVFTIGFARRATAYKRVNLLFSNIDRLRQINREIGPLQVIYAGKAHPRDDKGKELIREIFAAARELKEEIPVLYLEGYDMELAKYLCSGVDLWLNTPKKPQEASGTSGMKAALNGVPSLSILDGWWLEGHVEDVTGWSIVQGQEGEAASLYQKLEKKILPWFYNDYYRYAKIMRHAIALNGAFFTAHRMMYQYYKNAYLPTQNNHIDRK